MDVLALTWARFAAKDWFKLLDSKVPKYVGSAMRLGTNIKHMFES